MELSDDCCLANMYLLSDIDPRTKSKRITYMLCESFELVTDNSLGHLLLNTGLWILRIYF